MGFLKILIFCIICSFPWPSIQSDHQDTYIIQVESPENHISTQSSFTDLESYYHSFLPITISSLSEKQEPRIIYSYQHVMKGFAAKLTSTQLKEMEKKHGFVSARKQRILPLHTTHTPNFLGLQQNLGLWKGSIYGKGVIIGVLDTGITPDHPSFSDAGMPPPPAKWKGVCEPGFKSRCNNKLIGVRFYKTANGSAIDDNGHGTHTASIAAGAFVKGANVYGNANGTAIGIAPLAHLAIYKACNGEERCQDSDVLAAMDAAIDDGVDILSVSLGGLFDTPFYEDSIAIAAYTATEKGILVSASAGNFGPSEGFIGNEAPWILTSGASTHDRKLKATVKLGNKEEFEGESAYSPETSNSTFFTLFDPSKNTNDTFDTPFCRPGTLTDPEIKGKIVLCLDGDGGSRVRKGRTVKAAGGVGMIIINVESAGVIMSADAHVIPALEVSRAAGYKILDYMNSTSNPVARISFQGTIFGDKNAPIVAPFSARGPNKASPGILKPDIIGPGVNILAAWPTSVDRNTATKSTFNILSGTSMSCAHLSGVAALLKSAHPEWSPAAIKSAIMTTADTVNLARNPIPDERLVPANIFAVGAGHVNPSKANDPGLIYDSPIEDYLPYMCGLNYTNRQIGEVLQHRVDCRIVKSIPEAQLNYPTFSIELRPSKISQTYTRTVTNVGDAKSTYNVEIVPPKGVAVKVNPTRLDFTKLNQKLTYQVTFSNTTIIAPSENVEGYLKWNSNKHSVRSPIAVVLFSRG